MLVKVVHAATLVGNIHDVNEVQDEKVVVKVLTFIFDGKTMVFNCEQLENELLKPYIDPAVPVEGKYTFCKLVQLVKQDVISIAPTTVGILVNFTHSN